MVHKGKKIFLKKEKHHSAVENIEQPKAPKKAKIIVRNLPFKNLSEDSVKEFFKEYGDIHDVKLLKKEDGKFVGCGFVHFQKVSSAVKAIRHANQKEMNGRKIVVDWALPKNTFLEKVQKLEGYPNNNNFKSENLSDDECKKFEIEKLNVCGIKEETEELKSEAGDDGCQEQDDDDDDRDDSDGDDDDDDDDNDSYDYDDENEEEEGKKKSKIFSGKQETIHSTNNSNDVEDGKTVFFRNIPFCATNEDLKNCVEAYGPVEYAVICTDKLTEHSKGTGFVKFKDKECASQCIRDSTKIYLQDNPLTATIALSKSDLEKKKKCEKVVKDSRNLYLIREGVVIAGSKAAAGVSGGDMAKRLQLEQWKNQILKNLNMFVSRTRLVVHNLPSHFDDAALKNLFLKYSNPKAFIKEAKVMYDKKKVDLSGKGVSKGIGFVSFTKHEDALQALRNINNNPEIFTSKKRPIVAFSIENKAVINSKIKRVEKSRSKLGISDDGLSKLSKLNRKQRRFLKRKQKFIERRKEAQKSKNQQSSDDVKAEQSENNKRKRNNIADARPAKKRKTSDSIQSNPDAESNTFRGVTSESGKKIKLRSKFRLKNQAKIHHQTLKQERRKRRERERKNIALRKSPKEKKGKMRLIDDTSLSKLLKKHRENIQQFSVTKKWYDN